MALASGPYTPKHTLVVTHWSKPDANGDGEEVWSPDGDDQETDAAGVVKRHYLAPAGFEKHPTRNENGVITDETMVRKLPNGAIKRAPNGEAVTIYPGETLVEYPDGSFRKLLNDRDRKLFEAAHAPVSVSDA
jgi:hypothetical protein